MRKSYTEAYLKWISILNSYNINEYIKFEINGSVVGWIHRHKMQILENYPHVFDISSNSVSLKPSLHTQQARTQVLDQVVREFYAQGIISGWRDEQYLVSTSFHATPCMYIERSAAAFFGILKYGVHVNGITTYGDDLHMWVARRSKSKPKFPGYLDNIVAGGLSAHLSPRDVVIKECKEEAAISRDFAEKVKSVGYLSYCIGYKETLVRDIIFLYDLELPRNFEPLNEDGEIEEFSSWTINEVMKVVATTKEFRPNCNLVIIDFLIRHGYICPEDNFFIELTNGLRNPFVK